MDLINTTTSFVTFGYFGLLGVTMFIVASVSLAIDTFKKV